MLERFTIVIGTKIMATEIITPYPLPPWYDPYLYYGWGGSVSIEKRLGQIEERLSRIEEQLSKNAPTE